LAAFWSVTLVWIAFSVIFWISGSQNSDRLALAVLFGWKPLQPTTTSNQSAPDG
jgi:hypothetical protein